MAVIFFSNIKPTQFKSHVGKNVILQIISR